MAQRLSAPQPQGADRATGALQRHVEVGAGGDRRRRRAKVDGLVAPLTRRAECEDLDQATLLADDRDADPLESELVGHLEGEGGQELAQVEALLQEGPGVDDQTQLPLAPGQRL